MLSFLRTRRPSPTQLFLLVLAAAGCSGDGGGDPSPPGEQLGEISVISAGDYSTCVVNSLAKGFCWGANASGQLGDGTRQNRRAPVSVAGDLVFSRIRAGDHACAIIAAAGSPAVCWGLGTSGQLGNAASSSSSTPVPVSGGLAFSEISVGGSTCGIAVDPYCWGPNGDGQLGSGDLAVHNVPTPISGGLQLGGVSVGGRTACGLASADDAAYCWGNGADGELGDGNFGVSSDVPVPVEGNLFFGWLSVGGSPGGPATVCGVEIGGEAYCWGSNADGQVGDGTIERRSSPVPIGAGLNFTEIHVGRTHACGRTAAGVAYCWGAGGLLGTGTNLSSHTPIPVAGGFLFATLTAGAEHTCGRTEDAAVLYCWGSNALGQLGDGTTTRRLAPVKVLGQE